MSSTPYEVGEVVTAKRGRATFTGEIKAIGAQLVATKGKDMRKVTIAARWKDMVGNEHITEVEVLYWNITARLEQGNQ